MFDYYKRAAVVIPTIGHPTLTQARDSVNAQSYSGVVYPYVFTDGPLYSIDLSFLDFGPPIAVTYLGDPTGKVGEEKYWGHRIYAASAHLVNADYVFFLDDDNWYDREHVESLIDLCERKDLHFAFSRRKIISADNTVLCEDRCESLGFVPVCNDPSRGYHVDTSSYCFRRDFLIQVGHFWHGGYAQDRKFFNRARTLSGVRYGTTNLPTLNYRLGSTETSASPDFFIEGNKRMQGVTFQERTNVD